MSDPGHRLRAELDEAQDDIVSDAMILTFMPVFVAAIYLTQGHIEGLQKMQHLMPFYILATVAFIAWMIRKLWKASERLDILKTGYDAELAVGQELDQLMRLGARVFHDFPAENFNIDHIVIAKEGVFAVETKGYTKRGDLRGREGARVVYDGAALRFPHMTRTEPLEQAKRQAEWLAKWLGSAVGQPVRVMPVLALPGWFVERTGKGPIRVFSGRALSALLRTGDAWAVSESELARIAHQIEQRCRDVSPRYGEEVRAA